MISLVTLRQNGDIHSESITAFMSDLDDLPPEYADVPRGVLKHGKGRYKDVILVPQPSESPNDPLNWPQW